MGDCPQEAAFGFQSKKHVHDYVPNVSSISPPSIWGGQLDWVTERNKKGWSENTDRKGWGVDRKGWRVDRKGWFTVLTSNPRTSFLSPLIFSLCRPGSQSWRKNNIKRPNTFCLLHYWSGFSSAKSSLRGFVTGAKENTVFTLEMASGLSACALIPGRQP